MSEIFTVPCPTCYKSVTWNEENAFRPFCSKRCQLIDLGEWAAEEKSIPSYDPETLMAMAEELEGE